MTMKDKMKYALSRKYPFIKKVPKTQLDIIYDTYKEAVSLFVAVAPILAVTKTILFVKQKIGGIKNKGADHDEDP